MNIAVFGSRYPGSDRDDLAMSVSTWLWSA